MGGRDIDEVLAVVARIHPLVESWQLRVSHAADDDGIWFFKLNGIEVQAESSTGNCPFLVESRGHSNRTIARNISELLRAVETELGLPTPEPPQKPPNRGNQSQ